MVTLICAIPQLTARASTSAPASRIPTFHSTFHADQGNTTTTTQANVRKLRYIIIQELYWTIYRYRSLEKFVKIIRVYFTSHYFSKLMFYIHIILLLWASVFVSRSRRLRVPLQLEALPASPGAGIRRCYRMMNHCMLRVIRPSALFHPIVEYFYLL